MGPLKVNKDTIIIDAIEEWNIRNTILRHVCMALGKGGHEIYHFPSPKLDVGAHPQADVSFSPVLTSIAGVAVADNRFVYER